MTSPHHLSSPCLHHFLWNHFGWHYNSSPPWNVMSFHYIDVFWLHLIWNDLTSPPFSSYVIPFHCKASYITAFRLVSSCLIWKMCHGATPSATKHLSHGLRKPAKAVEFWGHKLWILIPFQPQVVRLFLEDLKNKLRMAKSGTFEQWEKKGWRTGNRHYI